MGRERCHGHGGLLKLINTPIYANITYENDQAS